MKNHICVVIFGVVLALTACQGAAGGEKSAAGQSVEAQKEQGELSAGEPAVDSGRKGTQEPITLTLANNLSSGSCTTTAIEWFAAQVEARSEGRIHIEVYNNSALGDSLSCLEQLQYGSIDIVKTDVSVMANYVSEYHAFVMPYVYQDTEHFRKVHRGEIGMNVLRGDSMQDLRMYGLTYYDGGARCFYSKKPIHSPQDMRGMMVRVQESRLMMEMVEALGGTAVPLEYGDVYAALQESAVSAAENSIVNYLEQHYDEVAPYFVEDSHTRNADILVMSEVSREKLSEEDLALIDETALESWEYQQQLWDAAEEKARQELKVRNGTIIEPTETELQAFRKACEPVWSSYEGGAYIDLIDRIVAAGRL